MIAAGRTYSQMRPVILNAPYWERIFASFDEAFLWEIQTSLAWNDFARILGSLGRRPPDGNSLLADAAVQAALGDAWTGSNPAATSWSVDNPAHPSHAACGPSQSPLPRAARTGTHEEGGWIYFNVVTGGIYTRRAGRGAQAALTLANPPQLLDSIVVGVFHTHPNLGACWNPARGRDDRAFSRFHRVPVLARGQVGGVQRDFVAPAPGVQRRAHLAGPRGLPGAGAVAPQPVSSRQNGAMHRVAKHLGHAVP